MSSFLEMIRLGATSPNDDVRKANEERLINYRQQDPANFLKDCMVSFSDKNTDPSLKQAIGTIIKISFASENVDSAQQVPGQGLWWYTLEKNAQTETKNIFIENLISKDDRIKLVSADAISTIFVLDYPKKDWPDLLEILAKNTAHSNLDVQRSAIITLGYICEKLASYNLEVKTADSDSIASGIASGLMEEQQNSEIKLTALKALQDSLPLFEKRFQEEDLRDIMLTMVIKACSFQNDEVVHRAVQCLGDMFKSCYRYLTNRHMEVIAERTLSLLSTTSISIIIAITDFWTRVAKHEEKLQNLILVDSKLVLHNFTRTFSKAITQQLLPLLTRKDHEDIEAGLSLHGAALDCMIRINTLAQEDNRAINMEFIDKMMSSNQEKHKVAALLCFEAMIMGYQSYVTELIASSFSTVLGFLTVNATLCKAALKVIKATALKYPEVLLKDSVCVEWLELLMNLAKSDAQLGKLVCEVITNVAEGLCNTGKTEGYFVSKADHLCEILVENCFTSQSGEKLHVINECLTTVVAIIKGMHQPSKLIHMVNFLSQAVSNLQMASSDSRALLKEGILVCCLASIYMLKKSGVQRGDLNETNILTIYQFCFDECNNNGSSFSDALTVLIAIANRRRHVIIVLKSEITPEKLNELCSFASVALKSIKNETLMSSGLESIGDLVRGFPAQMAPHVLSILQYLIECLNDPSLSKNMRLSIFIAIGDLAIGCPQEVKKEMDRLFKLYLLAFDAVIQILSTQTDESNLEFAQNLKVNVVESLTCLSHGMLFTEGVSDNLVLREFCSLITPLNTFLSVCLQPNNNPSSVSAVDLKFFIEQSFQLMIDLGQILKPMCNQFDNTLLHTLKQHYIAFCKTSSQFQELIDYFETVFRF